MAVTTAAIIGIAAAGATTAQSFAAAGKQRKLMRQAESEANKAMAEARKKIEVNYMEALAIRKEPYELAREEFTKTAAQAIEAGRESERGAAATAGRVQMVQAEAQEGVRASMSKSLEELERATAEEQSRLRDIGTMLDLGEVQGAQQAMADAQRARAAYMEQGFQGVSSVMGGVGGALPLFYQQPLPMQVTNIPTPAERPISTPSIDQLGPQTGGTAPVGGLQTNPFLGDQYGGFGSPFSAPGLGG